MRRHPPYTSIVWSHYSDVNILKMTCKAGEISFSWPKKVTSVRSQQQDTNSVIQKGCPDPELWTWTWTLNFTSYSMIWWNNCMGSLLESPCRRMITGMKESVSLKGGLRWLHLVVLKYGQIAMLISMLSCCNCPPCSRWFCTMLPLARHHRTHRRKHSHNPLS